MRSLIAQSIATTLMLKGSIFVKTFVSMLKDDAGQGLVEYAIIIALVSVVAIAALKLLGGNAKNALNSAASNGFS